MFVGLFEVVVAIREKYERKYEVSSWSRISIFENGKEGGDEDRRMSSGGARGGNDNLSVGLKRRYASYSSQ